jgi:hypothetical protein
VVNFGGFFAELGHFAGFSLLIINFAIRISDAVIGGVGRGTLYLQMIDRLGGTVDISEAAIGGGSGDIFGDA